MATRVTFERPTRKVLGQFRRAFGGHLVQNFGERSCCRTEWHSFVLLSGNPYEELYSLDVSGQ